MVAPAGLQPTQAERRVLSELRRGKSNGSIATTLAISRRTVECHLSRLLSKTGCRNRTQLLLWSMTER